MPDTAYHEPRTAAGRLEVQVVFTGAERTRAALDAARRLAHDLHGQVRLVAAQVVPYPLPLQKPPVPVELSTRRLRALVESAGGGAEVQLALCRDEREALASLLAPGSVVVVGGRSRWWLTPERRLARWLESRGHSVVFVPSASR